MEETTIDLDTLAGMLKQPAFEDDHRVVVKEGNETHIYLYGDIQYPIDYVPEMKALDLAKDGDIIYIHLNTYGGLMISAVSWVNAIRRSKAHVIAICDVAMSAGTIITLACDEIWYTQYTEFMIHDISGGSYGNTRDQKVQQEHYEKYFTQFLYDAYEGFLTTKEVDAFIAKGTDWYMVGDELQTHFDAWSLYTGRPVIKR